MATYQSLYRRYRSQRFDEVLGQDHITRALRNAVREGRVGHAYLFSGPRGTGKTSTARILAKVLNCANPQDGEPCGVCDNCVAVADGRVTDWLLEQDAASKSKVDDMRDLLERVPLGTSGNRKVIILDEVHMLSQGAENALLKTLEEPPDHVVFVLATTDPQKVRPTIRSRTQSFEFHLLPPDVMAEHVRHVIDDAGLGLGDDAVEHVVRLGGGSARDTLSALDQVAALGEVVSDREPVDAVVDALCDRDAGAALVAVADALAVGRDPRTLGEDVIAALRNAFLSVMGVGDTHLAPVDRARAADVGQRLGAAGLTRALEVLGEALTELARKPDPRIVVEVALVRLTRPDADRSLDAVLERLDRLEQGLPAAAAGAPKARPSRGGSRAAAPSGSTVADAPPATVDAPEAGAGPAAATPTGAGGSSVADARAALAARRKGAGAAKPKATPGTSGPAPAPPAGAATEPPAPPADAPGPEPAVRRAQRGHDRRRPPGHPDPRRREPAPVRQGARRTRDRRPGAGRRRGRQPHGARDARGERHRARGVPHRHPPARRREAWPGPGHGRLAGHPGRAADLGPQQVAGRPLARPRRGRPPLRRRQRVAPEGLRGHPARRRAGPQGPLRRDRRRGRGGRRRRAGGAGRRRWTLRGRAWACRWRHG